MKTMRRFVLASCLAGILPALAIAANQPSEKPTLRAFPIVGPSQPGPGTPQTPAVQLQAQQTHGQRCVTQVGICLLNVPGPIGYPCTCMFALGPIPGHIVP